jgi:hypothetical protein
VSNFDYSDYLIQDPDLLGGVYPGTPPFAPGNRIPIATAPPAPAWSRVPPPPSVITDPTSVTGDFENDAAGDRNMPPLPKGAVAPTAIATPPGMLNTPPFVPNPGYEGALNKLESKYGDYPQMQQPKWWQRLGGAAAGFGAGWSNAASRTRNPIDIAAMQENILHPGYRQKLEEWQSRVTPAQAQAEIEGQKQQAWWKNQEAQSRIVRDKAYADYMEGLGRGGSVEITPAIESATGGQLKQGDRVPASLVSHALDIAAGKYADKQPVPVYNQKIADILGVKIGTPQPKQVIDEAIRQITALEKTPTSKPIVIPSGGTLYNPDTEKQIHNPKEWDPSKGETKPPGPKDFAKLEVKKNTQLAQAEAGARKRIAGGEDPDQVYADLTKQKQQFQNDFENEVNALGGSAKHFEYPSGSAPAPPTATARQQATPAKTPAFPYTEQQVRAAATAKHKDPDEAVRIARQRKLIP